MFPKNKIYKYSLFNFTFAVDFPLKNFDSSDENPVFSVKHEGLKRSQNYTKPWSSLNLDLAVIEDNEFLAKISGGKSIKYNFIKDFSEKRKIVKLFHQPMAYILFQLGCFVLHGSAFVNKNNEGIVLCGLSGSGKSQMLYEFSKNYKVISDDIVATDLINDSVLCLPGLPFICAKDNRSQALEFDSRKRSYIDIAKDNRQNISCKIKKIIFLEWGDNDNLTELEDETIFKKLILNSFRPLPQGSDKNAEKQYLTNISKLARCVKFYKFTRKKGEIKNSINFLKGFIND